MTQFKNPKISEAEWAVMEQLWLRGPMRSAEIVQAVGQHPKTVKTYIGRLVKKGAVASEKEGSVYRYRALVKKSDCQAEMSQSFLEKVFGGALVPMVAHFVRKTPLSEQEIETLQRILDERRKK